ncbi:hypothetical protein JAAARDRAFT_396980 [Jaapia argillacea MUCL 33604]|uniref:Uncharacterized protein n=1 Tax=Jaapia argillacea MUCL 33604 TaxID=933084 RepID=A0A067PL23_9AGAM|nr:hypothetical protein JAAARDRAFT_396980 [Jaapia argillacea MUCL 33604]
MCCNAFSKAAPANDDKSVHIDQELVATPLPDGYWLNAFPFSEDAEVPDLVGYGLGFEGKPAAIKLFQNPKNSNSEGWKLTEIQSMDFPVAMVSADLTGNGYNDIIITDRYGPSMGALWDAQTNNGGRIQWLRNPGDRDAQPYWEAHHIGNSTGMHRVQVGHFTTSSHFQVMGLPIIPASNDLTSPAPVILYDPTYGPEMAPGPIAWSEEIIFSSEFRLIHDAKLLPGANNGLDMVLVAGREGTVCLWFDQAARKWEYNIVGSGLPQQGDSPYWGSGSVDVARVGADDVGYIATCEGFHGNSVAVYVKADRHAKGAASLKNSALWRRIVIDNFGPLDPEQHTGTIHNVATVRVPGSDIDSFAIACMGSPLSKPENQGVYLYTPIDLVAGRFKRTKITDESAGRLAVAGYTEPQRMDIGSISYYVPGYHTGPDPSSIRINVLQPYNVESRTSIVATKLNKEVLLRVPRPNAVPEGVTPTMPIVTLVGNTLTLVVLRPGATMTLGVQDAAKVVYGSIEMTDPEGNTVTRTIATNAKEIATTHIVSADGVVKAGGDGAVFLHVGHLKNEFHGPFTTMSQVTANNIFPRHEVPPDVRAMEFPFIKVQDLDWGSSGLWDDFEFYNMTGFYVFFNDDAMEEIVHMQAWTLGIGETARFHNHSDRSFCEIHYCLSNGGGTGGMVGTSLTMLIPSSPTLSISIF